jgi:hypothetical protein
MRFRFAFAICFVCGFAQLGLGHRQLETANDLIFGSAQTQTRWGCMHGGLLVKGVSFCQTWRVAGYLIGSPLKEGFAALTGSPLKEGFAHGRAMGNELGRLV